MIARLLFGTPLLFLAACAAARLPDADLAGDLAVGAESLHYESFGAAEDVVVLVHGGGVDRRVWDGQIHDLLPGFRVVRYDRRGYGRSSAPRGEYSDTDDLRALLDGLGIGAVHLVGSSTGAGVALDFALRWPERARSLVLISAKVDGYRYSGHETRLVEAIFQAAHTAGDDAGIAHWLEKPGMFADEDDTAPARSRMRELLRENRQVFHFPSELRTPARSLLKLLSEIRAPVLLVSGEADTPDQRGLSELLGERLPGARRLVLEDAGHMLHLERPQLFNRLTLDFLREVGTRGEPR